MYLKRHFFYSRFHIPLTCKNPEIEFHIMFWLVWCCASPFTSGTCNFGSLVEQALRLTSTAHSCCGESVSTFWVLEALPKTVVIDVKSVPQPTDMDVRATISGIQTSLSMQDMFPHGCPSGETERRPHIITCQLRLTSCISDQISCKLD